MSFDRSNFLSNFGRRSFTEMPTLNGPLQEYERHFSGICLFVCLVALRPKSTAMVIAGRTVDLTTLFPGQA